MTNSPIAIVGSVVFYALHCLLKYSQGFPSVAQLLKVQQATGTLPKETGGATAAFSTGGGQRLGGSSSSSSAPPAPAAAPTPTKVPLSPYQIGYWVSLAGGQLLFAIMLATAAASAPKGIKGLDAEVPNDLLINLCSNGFLAVIANTLARVVFIAHFALEWKSKTDNRQEWTNMLASVPYFSGPGTAATLLTGIIYTTAFGCVLAVTGGIGMKLFFDTEMNIISPAACWMLVLMQAPATALFEGGSFGTNMGLQALGMALMGQLFLCLD